MTSQAENQTGLARPEAGRVSMQRIQKLVAAGGVLGALAASSCCILPLVLFGLGVSGAWIGNLTRLAPYQPYFIVATAAALAAVTACATAQGRPPARMAKSVPDRCRTGSSRWASFWQRSLSLVLWHSTSSHRFFSN
jgi:mercuric ion transport protein